MLDSTAEREAWEQEIAKVVSQNPAIRSAIREMVDGAVDSELDSRTGKGPGNFIGWGYGGETSAMRSGNHLVTFDDLWSAQNTLERNDTIADKRLESLEAWRNTRWHVKAGRALKATWNGFFLPLIVASVVVFMLHCTLTVVIGWLS